jgi:hypothetical protein
MKQLFIVLFCTITLCAQVAREITTFTLFKGSGTPVNIDGVGVLLKGTDVGKQRAAIEFIIDGHHIEKKDVDLRMPIYFYVGDNVSPHELVILKVADGRIDGRFSRPK